jgi:hypothetical protein
VDRGLMLPTGTPPAGRRARWAVLLLGVLLVHASAVLWLQEHLVGWGAGDQPMPARMEVAFVKELAPAAPPAAAAAPVRAGPKATTGRKPAPPLEAASAPSPEVAPEPQPEPVPPSETLPIVSAIAASAPAPEASAVTAAASAPATVSSAPSVAATSAFEWPPSTRLTYALVGNYRGEIHGNAVVQWVRIGTRYQVHLDVTVGPGFAPLITRRMTSDGDLGETGLVPRRYDEATRLPFQTPRRVTVQFTPGQVTLGNGTVRDAPEGVQDTASQFVQLTWLFTTNPKLLRVGQEIALPLALPRRVDRWFYDVIDEERLATPVGTLDTFHLKPRRADDRPRGELSAEVWFAPTLQYLPVRIRIQQDADTFVDLVMNAAPLQVAPEAGR